MYITLVYTFSENVSKLDPIGFCDLSHLIYFYHISIYWGKYLFEDTQKVVVLVVFDVNRLFEYFWWWKLVKPVSSWVEWEHQILALVPESHEDYSTSICRLNGPNFINFGSNWKPEKLLNFDLHLNFIAW